MKTLFKILAAAAIAAIGIVAFALSGIYDVSARAGHSGVVNWLLTTTSHASIERRSGRIEVPDLSDASLARAGAADFDAMCAACHGAPGQEPEAVGKGLNPAAPDLSESAAHMDAAELFWVTKNGIRMTGMPAWGATHDDDGLWSVVAFVTKLSDLDAEAYQALLSGPEPDAEHAPVAEDHDNDR